MTFNIRESLRSRSKNVQDFLKQTEGVYTNDILRHLGRPTLPDREIKYTGPLSIQQQWYILCEIMDDTPLTESS